MSKPLQIARAFKAEAANGEPTCVSIEDIVDTRVISNGFLIPPSLTPSAPDPSITQVKLLIESLQSEIQALQQRQQATETILDPLKSQYQIQNSQIHSLDTQFSQYKQDQHKQNQDFQTFIQDKCKEDMTQAWSLQRNDLETFWEGRLSESLQQEHHQRQTALQNLQTEVHHQLRQEFHQHVDTRLSTCVLEWKDIEQRIQGQSQELLNHWHQQWVQDLKSWWEQETNQLQQSLMQQIQHRIQEEQEAFKKTVKQPVFNHDSIFLEWQNNLMQKMDDKLHKHLQQMSHQYQALETTWRKKFDYMNDRCALLEKHLLNNETMNASKTAKENKSHPPPTRTEEKKKNTFSSTTKNEKNYSNNVYNFDRASDDIKVEINEPLHTTILETSSSDDEVETIKVVRPPPPDPVHPPENKRAKNNSSTKEPSSVRKEHTEYNTTWSHGPPIKKRVPSKDTSKSNMGSSKVSQTTFNFNLNQQSAQEEQERLLRESADRVRAQQEEARRKLNREENCAFVEPVEDLTKLPVNHWKWSDMYARLGLPPKASDELVKKHYRKLCLIYHPDKDRSGDDSNADRFQGIKEAYESIMAK